MYNTAGLLVIQIKKRTPYTLCPLSPLVLPINHAYALLCHCSVYLLSLLPPPPLRFEEAIISRADAGLAFWQGRLAD